MANHSAAGSRLIDRRTVLQAGAALAAAGPALMREAHAEAQPPSGHRCPGPCLCGEHAGAALAQRAELARSRHRRRDGGGDGQGRRRRRDLHLPLFDVPVRRQLCGGGATGPPRQVRPRQAGQPGRSGGGRCHRRLEEDAGHGRHPHHPDQGGEARAGRPGPRPHRCARPSDTISRSTSCSGAMSTRAPR